MADLTAALFESTLRVNEACTKAFVPRTSIAHYVIRYHGNEVNTHFLCVE